MYNYPSLFITQKHLGVDLQQTKKQVVPKCPEVNCSILFWRPSLPRAQSHCDKTIENIFLGTLSWKPGMWLMTKDTRKVQFISNCTSLLLKWQLILGFSSSYTLLKRLVHVADRTLKTSERLPARPPHGIILAAQQFLLWLRVAQPMVNRINKFTSPYKWTMSSKVSPLTAKPNKTIQLKRAWVR